MPLIGALQVTQRQGFVEGYGIQRGPDGVHVVLAGAVRDERAGGLGAVAGFDRERFRHLFQLVLDQRDQLLHQIGLGADGRQSAVQIPHAIVQHRDGSKIRCKIRLVRRDQIASLTRLSVQSLDQYRRHK